MPEWQADRRWLPDELLWIVGCTYRGHRTDPGPIRNPIGCNMAFRREELTAVGAFSTEFGEARQRTRHLRRNRGVLAPRASLRPRPGPLRTCGAGSPRGNPGARLVEGARPALPGRGALQGPPSPPVRQASAVGRERDYVRRLVLEAVPRLLVTGLRQRTAAPRSGRAQ